MSIPSSPSVSSMNLNTKQRGFLSLQCSRIHKTKKNHSRDDEVPDAPSPASRGANGFCRFLNLARCLAIVPSSCCGEYRGTNEGKNTDQDSEACTTFTTERTFACNVVVTSVSAETSVKKCEDQPDNKCWRRRPRCRWCDVRHGRKSTSFAGAVYMTTGAGVAKTPGTGLLGVCGSCPLLAEWSYWRGGGGVSSGLSCSSVWTAT